MNLLMSLASTALRTSLCALLRMSGCLISSAIVHSSAAADVSVPARKISCKRKRTFQTVHSTPDIEERSTTSTYHQDAFDCSTIAECAPVSWILVQTEEHVNQVLFLGARLLA